MKKLILVTSILFAIFDSQAQKIKQIVEDRFIVYNRTITSFEEGGKKFIRLSEAPKNGIAWLEGKEFIEGSIEFDVRGRDELQKSFVGVAFHGIDDTTYEAVYFRPFNFNVADKARNAHGIQYIFEPYYPWFVLRKLRYDEFEANIGIPNIRKTDWFHVKIEVRNGRIKVYVNGSEKSMLDVATLNSEEKIGSKIGFWVGDNSNGDFANFKITE